MNTPKGWHSRGYLPHCDTVGLIQSITFRLKDSVPNKLILQWKEQLDWQADLPADSTKHWELRKQVAQYEDAGHGHCHLSDCRIAELIQNALLYFDRKRYQLLSWCIMPNHVHVLIKNFPGYQHGSVVHSWKRHTARQANLILKTKDRFWAPDYFDRYIRDQYHLENTIHYIDYNPVKAGLVDNPNEWFFGSARLPDFRS